MATIEKKFLETIMLLAGSFCLSFSFLTLEDNEIHKINISYIIRTEPQLNIPKLGFTINYLDDKVIYEFPISYRKISTDKDFNVASELTEERFEYLVTEKKSTTGIFYKFNTEGEKEIYKGTVVKIDTVISRYLNFIRKDAQGKTYTNFNITEGFSLIKKNLKEGGIIEEIYVPKNPPINSQPYKVPDSIYFHFSSKFNFVEYSLAKTLDSSRQMKYLGCRVVYLPKEISVNTPKLEAILEMKEISMTINNKTTLLKFIDRYRKEDQ